MNALLPATTEAHLPCLVASLIAGFEELLNFVRAQIATEKFLRETIELTADEYEKLLAAEGSHSDSSAPSSLVAKQFRELPSTTDPSTFLSPPSQPAQLAIHQSKMANMHTPQENGLRCPIAHKPRDPEDLERDFTTPGVQGTLGCPFAKMSNGLSRSISAEEDPIAAEFHQDKVSSRSPNTEQRTSQCPIRFLDKHSPEEIAQYFENHKHEIPRSHEICVRRYQQNEGSARKLDAKYGSLVNMIQGLGVKHKVYLPQREKSEAGVQDRSSTQAVEKWAEHVSTDPEQMQEPDAADDDEQRLSNFERPLREVRVGESPSRPWGIPVPAGKEPAPSALQSEEDDAHLNPKSESPQRAEDRKKQKCPIDHGHAQAKSPAPPPQLPDLGESKDNQRDRPQIIFNGPVFFGYTAEQVAAILQGTSLGANPPQKGP
ncbi:hypothetical protein ABEF95_005772 [Exophiala dermatitidis]